jgi:hypothetical protein
LTSNWGSGTLTSRANRDFNGRGGIESSQAVDIKASVKGRIARDSQATRDDFVTSHIEVAGDFDILTSSTSKNEVGASNASYGRCDHRDAPAEQFGDSSLADSRRRSVMHDNGVSRGDAT